MHLHCCCFFVWPCWPVLQTSPSHCLPASLELNAPAAETGEPFAGQPSSVPSRWRKRAVFCRRKNGITGNSEFAHMSAWNLPAQLLNAPVFDLSRSPEYFSRATSFGSCGSKGAFGGPGGAAGLCWDDKGERRGLVALLVPSNGWKELPIFISTSGPLSSRK